MCAAVSPTHCLLSVHSQALGTEPKSGEEKNFPHSDNNYYEENKRQ